MSMFDLKPWRVACASLAGCLVVLAFPSFGAEAGLDWLIWTALVPLLFATAGVGGRRGFLLGACAGLLIEAGGFLWILLALRRFTGLPSAVASLGFLGWLGYSTLPWAILGAVLGRCSRPGGLFWAGCFWVGVEHFFPRLFPWHLGGALYDRGLLVQTVDVWGASGLTALVFLANVCIFLALRSALRKEKRVWVVPAAVLLFLLGGSLLYGYLRLHQVLAVEREAPELRVALLQGSLDPYDRRQSALDYYAGVTKRLLETRKVDLVVWPEGSSDKEGLLGFDLDPASNPLRSRWEGRDPLPVLQSFVEAISVPLVAGGTAYKASRTPQFSNVLVYLQPGKPPGFYEKNVRVPFGEVVPLMSFLPEAWRRRYGIRVGTIAAGDGNPIFHLGTMAFRGLVCYEGTLPGYVPSAAEGADFLVNITEDIWYGRTAQIPQHVSVLRLRVVENRTALVRCSNIGPSGVVDITGKTHLGSSVFEPGVVVAELRPADLRTLYQAGGRYLPLALLAASLLRAAWISRPRRSRPVRP